jgi:hypothetical protein
METNSHSTQHVGHETRDVNIRALTIAGLIMFAILVLILISMKWMFFYLAKTLPLGPPTTPYETARTLPPEPRLQAAPAEDLKTYLNAQQQLLNSYGWVDRGNGIVRIPVDRAMDLILQRGLPVRQQAPPMDTAEVPTLSGGPDLGADPPEPDQERGVGKGPYVGTK